MNEHIGLKYVELTVENIVSWSKGIKWQIGFFGEKMLTNVS